MKFQTPARKNTLATAIGDIPHQTSENCPAFHAPLSSLGGGGV